MDISLGPEVEKNALVKIIHTQSYSYWLTVLKHMAVHSIFDGIG